jgi:hypothetical protein
VARPVRAGAPGSRTACCENFSAIHLHSNPLPDDANHEALSPLLLLALF